MIDAKLAGGSRHRSAAHDGEHEAEVIPVDRAVLIQHFRTSKVQYLGLESYKMQVQRVCKANTTGDRHDPAGTREDFMRSIGHFIGGKEVKGTSGRTADVWEPMTGDVQAKVALASKAEVRAAVENARTAQVEWAATNPQRRARVMMKFLELAQRDYDKLAERLAREHGKTVPDAKGDIQRGLEVVEFACGIPHLMKGEYTEGAGPGIDIYSMRQPLGVVAGITPFNFPAMIPMWKFAPAIACGNAFILKPSERDPGVPMMLPSS
jgi:malonate-semialdehyde dehydrogenase (acetylating)/methylmalonate-semialdehyde dehydrogenase